MIELNLSDQIKSDSPSADASLDRFRRVPFAKKVAKTLALRKDSSSLVVAINGRWGEGKTTALEYVYQELYQYDRVIAVKFNPWRFSDEAVLLRAFFDTVARALELRAPMLKDVGEKLRDYGGIVGEIGVEFHGAKFTAGNSVSKLGEKLAADSLDDRKRDVGNALRSKESRIVIFVDDVDRLDRQEIQAIFKLLKLVADFEYVSYVLAFDRDMVASALGEKYGAGDRESGYKYLEKIVQVSLDLPLADRDALTDLCLERINDSIKIADATLTTEQEREFQLAFLQYIVPDLMTPRLAILYGNLVAFTLPLLIGEVNPIDLLLLTGLKALHPKIHEHLRQFSSLYTGDLGWDFSGNEDRGQFTYNALEGLLRGGDPMVATRVRHLLIHLFPQLRDVFQKKTYGQGSASSLKNQRVSSPEYLRRYLSLSVGGDDVSDREFAEFLTRLPTSDQEAVTAAFQPLVVAPKTKMALRKLHDRTHELAPEAARSLATAISICGESFPEGDDELFSSRDFAAQIVRDCLKRLAPPKRLETAKTIVRSGQPIFFSLRCLDRMRAQRGEFQWENLFPVEEIGTLLNEFGDRVEETIHKGTSVLVGPPRVYGRLLFVWHESKGPEGVRKYATECVTADPNLALPLISLGHSFFRTGTEAMDAEGYETISKICDRDALAASITQWLASRAETEPVPKLVASFMKIHEQSNNAPPEEGLSSD